MPNDSFLYTVAPIFNIPRRLSNLVTSFFLSLQHFRRGIHEMATIEYFENFYHSFQTFFRLFSIVQEFIKFFHPSNFNRRNILSWNIYEEKTNRLFRMWISKILPVIKYLGRNLKYNIFMEYSNKLNKIQEWWKKWGRFEKNTSRRTDYKIFMKYHGSFVEFEERSKKLASKLGKCITKGEEGGGGGIVLAVFLKDISGQLFRRQGCIS